MFYGGSKHFTEGLNIPRRGVNISRTVYIFDAGPKHFTEGGKYSTEGPNILQRV